MPTISESLSRETKYINVNHAHFVALGVISNLRRVKPDVVASYDYWIDLNTPFVKDEKYVAGVIIRTKKGHFTISAKQLVHEDFDYRMLNCQGHFHRTLL